ncbi:MAG: hypothetical protein ACLTS6_00140 [Anaerobutyricum sp.]
MALSIADYLLQLPENMNFAKVQELSERIHSTIVCFPTTEAAHFS